jgi:hypothetical protein
MVKPSWTKMHPYFNDFMFQWFKTLYSCLSGNMSKRNINLWGYYVINSSETIWKAKAFRQSKAMARAGTTNDVVARNRVPLSCRWKRYSTVGEIYAHWNMEHWNRNSWKKMVLSHDKFCTSIIKSMTLDKFKHSSWDMTISYIKKLHNVL